MAMLIMTVGLLGLLQSMQVAYQHSARNKLREEAVLLADAQMNQFRSLSFDSITANGVFQVISSGGRRFGVIRKNSLMGGDIKKLTVSVTWNFHNVTSLHEIYSLKSQ